MDIYLIGEMAEMLGGGISVGGLPFSVGLAVSGGD